MPTVRNRDLDIPHLLHILLAGIEAAKHPPHAASVPNHRIGSRPPHRLIRRPEDADAVAAQWMTYMGLGTASGTPSGRDEGIDVVAEKGVAQVKMEGILTGRPVIQQLFGVSTAEAKQGLVFSLGGFTNEAITWADRVGVALFQFDLQGEPEPSNLHGRRLLESRDH